MKSWGRVRSSFRWIGAMAAWHALALRETIRHDPMGRSLLPAALLGGVLLYAPFGLAASRALVALAREEGFRPVDAALWPLVYALVAALMLGAVMAQGERWWVIRCSPVPRALLGADRTLGFYASALLVAGPYAWGALAAAGLEPTATLSVIALALALGVRVRAARCVGFLAVLVLVGFVGWSEAFVLKEFLSGDLPLYDPDQRTAREFLIPVLTRTQMPPWLEGFLRLPALVHGGLAAAGLATLATVRGTPGGNAASWAVVRMLMRRLDAATATAWARLLQHLESSLPLAVATAAFAVALEVYGVARVPRGLWVWWVLIVLWRPVWREPRDLPALLQANIRDAAGVERDLLKGRLAALAQSTLLTMALFARPLTGLALSAALWLLWRFPGGLLRLPAGARGWVLAVMGAMLSLGGG